MKVLIVGNRPLNDDITNITEGKIRIAADGGGVAIDGSSGINIGSLHRNTKCVYKGEGRCYRGSVRQR